MRGVTDMYDAQAQQKGRQGRLKIFFGYAAGVGKTYAMLEAAHLAQKQGVDVVVGYIERHTRPDTLALLDGLEQLPTAPWSTGASNCGSSILMRHWSAVPS